MTKAVARAACLLVATLALFLARPARAQVSIQTEVSAQKVEVGQGFQLQMTAMGVGGRASPTDPTLPVPPAVDVRGPSVGTQTQVSVNNGRMTQSTGISATWTLIPRRVGTLRIGPPSVDVGGKREKGRVVTVEVVPQGTLPRQRPRGFDPFSFDPFGSASGIPQNPFLDEPDEPPPVPEELRLERAPDPVAFLRAVVTPKNPVVGEQVTLRIYAYGGRGRFTEANPTEPSRADFLAYSPADGGMGEQPVRVRIGDADFIAHKMRELCLFPLHSGEVVIGPMTMTFHGAGYRSRAPIVRQSERVVLNVEEPPLKGRPPGYKIGDVGELELTARVDPLRITAGDGVSVFAKLAGTGNIPLGLVVPQQRGVEWLEPSVIEDIEANASVVKGHRVFTYVVKLSEPGRIDLGELTLPYFDPKKRGYAVARVALGKVLVDPNPSKAASPPPSSSGAASSEKANGGALPAARQTLAAFARPRSPFTDGLGFWALLLAGPLLVTLTGSGIALGRRAAERMKARRSDPDRLAAEALREADEAARTGRATETAGAVERALFRAIEAGTGLKARALLRNELEGALSNAGVPKTTMESTLSLLDACEALRFTEGASDAPPKALAERARSVTVELARKRRPR